MSSSPDSQTFSTAEWNAAVMWLDTEQNKALLADFVGDMDPVELGGFSTSEQVLEALGDAETGTIAVVFSREETPELMQLRVNRPMLERWAERQTIPALESDGFRPFVLGAVASRFLIAVIQDLMVNGDPDEADEFPARDAE